MNVRTGYVFFGALFLLMACTRVPITNRKQMRLLPESELVSMSMVQYREILQTSKVITNSAEAQLVQRTGKNISDAALRVLSRLGKASLITDYKWEYKLIESKEANAWCLPGGKIAVYSGLLPLTKDEAGLAAVVGHEVAHAIARHGNERMTQALLAQMGGIALSVALAEQPQATRAIFEQAYGIGITVGALLPFSRLHEKEADRIGMILMANAGYDPREAIKLWERMKAAKKGTEVPVFLSTHPSDEQRIEDLKEFLPEALKYYKK